MTEKRFSIAAIECLYPNLYWYVVNNRRCTCLVCEQEGALTLMGLHTIQTNITTHMGDMAATMGYKQLLDARIKANKALGEIKELRKDND